MIKENEPMEITEFYQEKRDSAEPHYFQAKRKINELRYDVTKTQAFINNISFPATIDELIVFITKHGHYNVEDILYDTVTEWTVPTWAKIGDIVFFMHTKTAKTTITRLRTEIQTKKSEYNDEQYTLLMEWINRGLELYKKYGGKIFAIGRVCGAPSSNPFGVEGQTVYHWHSQVYAEILVDVLDVPIDISEFHDFIMVSRHGAITGVFGKEYCQLRDVIKSKNKVPQYLNESESSPLPLSKVNPENWMQLTNEYRRCFMLESQFRSYYVDYLLKCIGDKRTFYKECRCCKTGYADSFVDNVILMAGKYLPVEVKLSVKSQTNIKKQVSKYCDDDYTILDEKENKNVTKNDMHHNEVVIIDTDNVYIYKADKNSMGTIFCLDNLRGKKDIALLREKIIGELTT